MAIDKPNLLVHHLNENLSLKEMSLDEYVFANDVLFTL